MAMDEDTVLGYNKDVEAFRELEYPMLKGQRRLNSIMRCC